MKYLSLRYHVNPFLLAMFFFALLFVSSVIIGYLVNKVAWIQAFDRTVYRMILYGPHPPWLDALVSPFNFNFFPSWVPVFESFLVVAVLACWGVIYLRRRHDFSWAVFASAVALIFDQAMAYFLPIVIYRQRPFIALPNNISETAKAIWSAWPSFPSGHVRDTAVFMTVLAAFMPKRLRPILFLFIVFIAWTRIYVGAHYPTDTIAGMIIGYLIGLIVLSVVEEVRTLVRKRKQHEMESPTISTES